MAPPPPKVKISNLMQAAKDEAVADPSAMEAKVRAEMAQRIKNHEERNAARKLTPQEKRDKKKRKLTNDPSSGGVPVSLCARRPPPEYPPMSPHVTLTRHSLNIRLCHHMLP
jgi:U4/U6 small nuclear ribonucleoprotein PRP3